MKVILGTSHYVIHAVLASTLDVSLKTYQSELYTMTPFQVPGVIGYDLIKQTSYDSKHLGPNQFLLVH